MGDSPGKFVPRYMKYEADHTGMCLYWLYMYIVQYLYIYIYIRILYNEYITIYIFIYIWIGYDGDVRYLWVSFVGFYSYITILGPVEHTENDDQVLGFGESVKNTNPRGKVKV